MFKEYRRHFQDLIKRFVEKGYNELTASKQIEKVDHLDRLLLLKHCKHKGKDSIPFSVTCNSVQPNIKERINKHWHVLNIYRNFKEIFNISRLMIAFRKNKSLKQLIGTNTIRNNQKFLTATQATTAGQCTPCYTSRSFYCQQVLKTTTFTSAQTRETFTIFCQVTCHSNYVIYLLECIMCKIQYVAKSEKSLNVKLNNHVCLMYDCFLFFVLYFPFSSEKTEKPLKGVKSQKKKKKDKIKNMHERRLAAKRENLLTIHSYKI